MFDEAKKLALSDKEIALIEAALHTQEKILSVQNRVDNTGHVQLVELRRLITRLGRLEPATQPCGGSTLGRLSRHFFPTSSQCS